MNNSIPLKGNTSTTYLSGISLRGLNAGDANSDGSIDAFDTILWELNNGKFEQLD